uniref:PDZK1 interacting protein 1 n=1 Tax=Nothoprocta perdicaria TaxID=30464 RepID=A0A8C6ZT35_NOTPE
MPTPRLVALGLLLVLESASCQEARGGLQPWLQGIIAVVVFLVLVAIAFMVNKLWCKEKDCFCQSPVSLWSELTVCAFLSHSRSNESEYTYENIVEPEEKVVTTAM